METRQILFRGQRLGSKEWVYGNIVFMYNHLFIITGDYVVPGEDKIEDHLIEVDPATVGQFTGLKDKNGKDIYEGDVLRFGYPVNGPDGEEDHIPLTVVIKFQGGAFWFTGDGYTDCNWHFYNAEDREIIGTIHDSPAKRYEES